MTRSNTVLTFPRIIVALLVLVVTLHAFAAVTSSASELHRNTVSATAAPGAELEADRRLAALVAQHTQAATSAAAVLPRILTMPRHWKLTAELATGPKG